MLAIQYPWRYASVFEELCDFHVLDASQDYTEYPSHVGDKRVWFDCSRQTKVLDGEDGAILPAFEEAGKHLSNQERFQISGKLNISLWIGDRKHLDLLKGITDLIAIPHFRYGRAGFFSPEEVQRYHAYEFCNLDELRRYPWKSLHTSIPCQAASIGIDLRQRERRPKYLPPFSYDMHLTDPQLELAYENAKAIKEAMNHGRSALFSRVD